tara:strand:+ start:276 stop:956 length:681 start_codon:yes stop_codon:yes gene_type:complete
MQLIKKFGYPAAKRMAPKYGITANDMKKAMSKSLNGGMSGSQLKVGPDFHRSMYEKLVNKHGMSPSNVPAKLKREHYKMFGNESMRIPRNVPPPGVRETGAAQLDRISKAGRYSRKLPPQTTPGDRWGHVPSGTGIGPRGPLKAPSEKYLYNRPNVVMKEDWSRYPGKLVRPTRGGEITGGNIENMLQKIAPAQRNQAIKLLIKMGLIGAGGAGAASMSQNNEGGI